MSRRSTPRPQRAVDAVQLAAEDIALRGHGPRHADGARGEAEEGVLVRCAPRWQSETGRGEEQSGERDGFHGNNDKIGPLVGGRCALLCVWCPQQTGPARSQGAEGLKCEAALGECMSR